MKKEQLSRKKENTRISRFLSLILRHHPELANLNLNKNGWAKINELLEGIKPKYNISRERLEEIVREDEKQRYSIDKTGKYIRANQGHSIKINLELIPQEPPEILWHGTGQKSVNSILKNGIKSMARQYVHLSKDIPTAYNVGKRHGISVIFQIDSKKMFEDGFNFYLSENKIWLTDYIPVDYIKIVKND